MKVLFVAPRLPWPADTGGKIRTLNILKQLAKRSQVHLVSFSFGNKDQEWISEFSKIGVGVTLVAMAEANIVQKILGVLINPIPYSMSKYYSPDMEKILTTLNQQERWDAIHMDHLHMAHYRWCFGDVPCFLDEHNVEYRILERCAEVEKNFIKKFLFSQQAGKMKKFENEKINEFVSYFAVSEDDRNILQKFITDKTTGHVIPNGVDTDFFQSGDHLKPNAERRFNEDSLIFTGSMDWLPNDDAVIFFCEKILPLIWKQKNNVKFYVVGKNPSSQIQDWARRDSRIVVTGRVADVRPLMAQSQIFVVPIRAGGGTRLKILEAMSMQKAVVSTTVGAEGITYTDGQNILLADTPEKFTQQVLFLLNDSQKAKDIGQAGRTLVREKYDWNTIGQKLYKIYEEIGNVRQTH